MGRERRNLPYPPPLSPQGAARLRSQRPISFVSVPSALAPRLFHLEQNVPSSQSPSLGFGVSIRKEEQNRARGHRNAGSALCGWENSPECPNLEQRRIPGSEPPPPPRTHRDFLHNSHFSQSKKPSEQQRAARRPHRCLGGKHRFLAFLRPWLPKGGRGGAQPRAHKAPGPGAAPRMEEGRSRRTCAAAHRPAPLPAPSRGAPTHGGVRA